MSRFPNGAPISAAGQQVVAVFNKAVTPDDLIDKCDAVWYNDNAGKAYTLHSYPNAQVGHSGRIILSSTDDPDDPHQISLDIDGNTLTWYRNSGEYLFDFDFNHQNRKMFDVNTGTYLLDMPVLSYSSSYLPIVKVNNEPGVEEDEVNIILYLSQDSLDPLCANPNNLEDIDVGEWFNGSYPETQEGYTKMHNLKELVFYICDIEYDWGDRQISHDVPENLPIVGGTLNLFID